MKKDNKTTVRRRAILEKVAAEPIVTPNQLCEHFTVSSETIRKDLAYLSDCGLILKVHGGVVLAEQRNLEKPHNMRSGECISEKKRIAAAACKLIQPGDVIIIENGTTMLELANEISSREDLLGNLSVVTFSFRVADILRNCEGINLFFLGGWLRHGDLMAYGHSTLLTLRQFNVDKAFIGTAGISETLMLTDYFDQEVALRKQIIEQSKHKFLLADASKYCKTRLLNVCNITCLDRIISDVGVDTEMQRKIREAGVELTLV